MIIQEMSFITSWLHLLYHRALISPFVLAPFLRLPVNAKTVTNVVASASFWDLSADGDCGAAGCDPRLATVSGCGARLADGYTQPKLFNQSPNFDRWLVFLPAALSLPAESSKRARQYCTVCSSVAAFRPSDKG